MNVHAEDRRILLMNMKFTLWAWALYWAGGGLLVAILGGLDPLSYLVVLASIVAFVVLLRTNVLEAKQSRHMKEFFVERPLYLVAALVFAVLMVAILPGILNFGLLALATLYLVATSRFLFLGIQAFRRAEGEGFAQHLDQVILGAAMPILPALILWVDALSQLVPALSVSHTPFLVILFNWMHLSYPLVLLVATRKLRDPLRWTKRNPEGEVVPDAEPDASAAA